MKQLKYLALGLLVLVIGCGEDGIPQKFYKAAEKGKIEYFKEGVAKGYDINSIDKFGTPAIIYAASHGRVEIVEYLIEQKANVNIVQEKTGVTAIGLASKQGYYEIVYMLLSAGANPNIKDLSGNNAVMWADAQQHRGISDLLTAKK